MASGVSMPNRGNALVCIITKEGTKPLMSVPRICDAGHPVTFRKDGGGIVTLPPARKPGSAGWTLWTV